MRTLEDHRTEAFERYVGLTTDYFAKIEAEGDTPWHDNDTKQRRALFDQRYTRPAPPEGLHSTLADIRGDNRRWTAS